MILLGFLEYSLGTNFAAEIATGYLEAAIYRGAVFFSLSADLLSKDVEERHDRPVSCLGTKVL
jgi:hypothetical protein